MMEVVKFSEILEQLKMMIGNFTLVPIIGAGFSFGCKAKNGIVPNGEEMKKAMIDKLVALSFTQEELKNKTFQQIAGYYNSLVDKKDKAKYLLDNFTHVKLPAVQSNFLKLPWKYLYTFNIDDGIEKSEAFCVVEPNRGLDKNIKEYGRILFKMHGDANNMAVHLDGDNFSVFDTDQYISSLEKNESMLEQLQQDYMDKNLIFLGCGLHDEFDLLHILSKIKNENRIRAERFYITDKPLSALEQIDLKKYGITKIVEIETYLDFYEQLEKIRIELSCTQNEELASFKNIPIEMLEAYNPQNKEYILNSKSPLNKKEKKIYLPYFFTSRVLSGTIVNGLPQYPVQIVYGKRISGKTYCLLDILSRIADKDKYYFDSREHINRKNIDFLLEKDNRLIIFDTNVLKEEDFRYILKYDLRILKQRNIQIVIASNICKKNEAIALNESNTNPLIAMYYLENRFSQGSESVEIKKKMSACNLMYFSEDRTILDDLIMMQKKIGRESQSRLYGFNIEPNRLYIVYLLILANYGKITSADLVKFRLNSEPYELMSKLDGAVEEDYREMITSSYNDTSYYQIVCNAQGWLLSYLSKIACDRQYTEAIINAFYYIVEKLYDENLPILSKNKRLLSFIKFDNINMLLGGVRNRIISAKIRLLIQKIYEKLKPMLSCDYQFNHQHAKCLLWAIEEADENNRNKDLDYALRSINLCMQQIQDHMSKQRENEGLKISWAHANFTLAIIRVKMFYFSMNQENFSKAVIQVVKMLQFPENMNANELDDEHTDDKYDYSVSGFMDGIIVGRWRDYYEGLEKNIHKIIAYRRERFYKV